MRIEAKVNKTGMQTKAFLIYCVPLPVVEALLKG